MTPSIPASSGIYRITCKTTGKFYVGSATNLYMRWIKHRSQLRNNLHPNSKLQNAWNKHTEAAFIFEVIELVLIPEMLIPREQHWIDTLKPIFNIAPKAGSSLGRKHTPDVIEKLRIMNTGRRHTPEAIERMRQSQKGHPVSQSAREKSRATQLGRPSPRKGKKQPPEAVERQRRSLTGYKHTEETKRNMGISHLGSKRSPETREKMRIAALGHAPTNAKTFIVTSPDGDEYTVHNLTAFCREHGLSSSTLTQVARGNRSHHKKWTARYPDPTES